MWIPALMGQADEQQQQKWLPPSQRLELIGTYAQTELGHGTFVRGLETTATYHAARQQFVVHSPTLSSTKWWPGGDTPPQFRAPRQSRTAAGKSSGAQTIGTRSLSPAREITFMSVVPNIAAAETEPGLSVHLRKVSTNLW